MAADRGDLRRAARAVAGGGRITILTGAGISAESGLRTFRDAGGIWEDHRLEDVATPEGFARDPDLVRRFYDVRRGQVLAAHPNAAHQALARLDGALDRRLTLITQNIDDLHERAGSRRVLHIHGEILKVRCLSCAEVLPWTGDILPAGRCRCGGALRPHVVWFGEVPFYLEEEVPAALGADVFVSIGTSGVVYPAAGFAAEARSRGAVTVEVNLEPSENWRAFDVVLEGRATERVPELVEAVLKGERST